VNKRIQELVKQTDIWCDQNVAQDSPMYNNQWENKFAELIVRECAELVKDFYQEDEFTCYSAKTEIKEHFGIEE
jgi:hypothetical protein